MFEKCNDFAENPKAWQNISIKINNVTWHPRRHCSCQIGCKCIKTCIHTIFVGLVSDSACYLVCAFIFHGSLPSVINKRRVRAQRNNGGGGVRGVQTCRHKTVAPGTPTTINEFQENWDWLDLSRARTLRRGPIKVYKVTNQCTLSVSHHHARAER